MKIGIITKANAKGQIVIPLAYRQALHITAAIPLHILQRGPGIYITPITGVVEMTDSGSNYQQVLAKTKGSWSSDDWPKRHNRQRKQELAIVQNHKKTTW